MNTSAFNSLVQESASILEEDFRLDKDEDVTHDQHSAEFASHYVKGKRGDHRSGGPTPADEKHAEHFHNTYHTKQIRSGFGGSGETEYTHKKTGEKYRVERRSNGKGFYGTTHRVSKVRA